MAEINTYPLQHQLLPSKSVQTVVCRQKQNNAIIGFSAYFRLGQFFEIIIQLPHLLRYYYVSLSVNFSHTLFVIPTMLHTKIQSHCDTV